MNHSNYLWNMPQDNVILGGNEVHVWKAPLEAPLNTIYSLQRILSEEEVKRARQFYFEKDRLHWIVARGILRILLGYYLDIDPRGVSFVTNGYGKPFIAYPSHGTRLRFNLTHSGELALYALTYDRHVGVDVEYMRSDIDCEKLAQYHFSPYERAALQALPTALRLEAFFLCWTRKEAYIKARGSGLCIPLDQFDVSLTPGEPAALLASREDPHATAAWSLHALAPGARYTGALVVEGTGWHLSCLQWPGWHTPVGRSL
jgi:4'-phosphopantetheinyl transferase